jgi:hypothetical protein
MEGHFVWVEDGRGSILDDDAEMTLMGVDQKAKVAVAGAHVARHMDSYTHIARDGDVMTHRHPG